MRRILFVDDEANVVRGLRRMLHPMSDEWDMHFCESGEEALSELKAREYDVLVSDLRMPVMDGVTLLKEVRDRHPSIVRIILSGHGDRTMILQSTEIAHQFLAKPCDPEELRATVSRTCSLRDALSDDRMRRLTANLTSLPSLPSLYLDIQREVQSPSGSLDTVGRIISRDVAMTAKVMQLVNSAFFGLRQNVSTPSDAVRYLGMDTVKALVLTVHVFGQFSSERLPGISLQGFMEHGLAVGTFARRIAQLEGADRAVADQAFLAGMMHDLGELVLAANLADDLARAHDLAAEDQALPRHEAERRVLGASHAVVGAYLLGIWGLPHGIVEAVAGHHTPSERPCSEFSVLTAVHAADVIESELRGLGPEHVPLDEPHLERLGLVDRLGAWREACQALAKGEAA